MSRYRKVAVHVARRAFNPGDHLESEAGLGIKVLVEEFADADDAEWLLEDEKAERRLENLLSALEDVLKSYDMRNMTAPLIPSDTATFFRFAVRTEEGDAADHREFCERLRLHADMLDSLRTMDPTDFENLCGRVLVEIGCEAVHVTRSSVDLGTDFFGRSPAHVGDLPPVGVHVRQRVLGEMRILLFGQAKRYADYNTIDADTVKLVEPTWRDIVRRRIAGTLPTHLNDALETIEWGPEDSVRFMFVTTSHYTDPAKTYGKHVGMIMLDGDQLAQLLLQQEIGVERDGAAGWTTSMELVTAACTPDEEAAA